MTENTLAHNLRYLSWGEVHRILFQLVGRIGPHKPDVIVAIAKGGLIPARIIADILGVEEIGFIEVKFYKGVGLRRDKPFIKQISLPVLKDKRVLIVDDIVDTGRTMQLVVDTVSTQAPKMVKTLALFIKPWSTYTPDLYHGVTEDWIVFPWEICETRKQGVLVSAREFLELSEMCPETTRE